MTNQTTPSNPSPANPSQPPAVGGGAEIGSDDPRSGYAVVTAALFPVLAGAADHLDAPTPCAEFTVKDLLEHVVMVQRRSAAIGRGEHWSSVQQEPQADGWADSFGEASKAVHAAWTDPAKLGESREVPWGEFPGAVVLFTYTAELAVHGWDLATATGQIFEIDDAALEGALFAAKMIPAEGRDEVDMPFDPVVDPGPGASALHQMAGWLGRQVI